MHAHAFTIRTPVRHALAGGRWSCLTHPMPPSVVANGCALSWQCTQVLGYVLHPFAAKPQPLDVALSSAPSHDDMPWVVLWSKCGPLTALHHPWKLMHEKGLLSGAADVPCPQQIAHTHHC
jgi:hypothetical protein